MTRQPSGIQTLRELIVSSRLEVLEGVCRELRDFCRAEPVVALAEAALRDLELATNEAVANAVQHAHADRTHEMLTLRLEKWTDRIAVHVVDRGDGFDPDEVPVPKLDGTEECGMGLYLMRTLVDEWSYERREGGPNTTTLVMRTDLVPDAREDRRT